MGAAGTLAAGDAMLPDKSFYDDYTFTAQAGQTIVVDMWSEAFDTYLILLSPSGETFTNDDHEGDITHSRIQQAADAGGTWTLRATSLSGFVSSVAGSTDGLPPPPARRTTRTITRTTPTPASVA